MHENSSAFRDGKSAVGHELSIQFDSALIDQAHPDGLILAPPACDDRRVIDELERRSIPFVRLQPGGPLQSARAVLMDNERAAFDMTSYLLSLGHHRIGFIVGDRGYAASGQRLAGHVRALSSAGVVTVQESIIR